MLQVSLQGLIHSCTFARLAILCSTTPSLPFLFLLVISNAKFRHAFLKVRTHGLVSIVLFCSTIFPPHRSLVQYSLPPRCVGFLLLVIQLVCVSHPGQHHGGLSVTQSFFCDFLRMHPFAKRFFSQNRLFFPPYLWH